jgi:hypothetical protein
MKAKHRLLAQRFEQVEAIRRGLVPRRPLAT